MSINFTPANREYLTAATLACMPVLNESDRLAFQVMDAETAHVKVQFMASMNSEDDIEAGFPYEKWNRRVVFDNPAISENDWNQYADLRSPLFSGGYALRRDEAALICPVFADADVALLTGHYDSETGIFTIFGDGILNAGDSMLLTIDQDLNDGELIQIVEEITQQLPASYNYGFELNQDTWRDLIIIPVGASLTETGALTKSNPAIKKILLEVAERHFAKEQSFEYHCSRNTVSLTNAYVVDSCGNVIEPNRVSEKACGRGVTLKVKEWKDLHETDAVMTCRTEMNGKIVLEIELVSGESLEKLTTLQYRQLCAIYKQITRWAFESFQQYNLYGHWQFTPPEFPLNNIRT